MLFIFMKIGLDFDGVVTDCGQLKSDGAKRLYGVDIPSERFKTELVVGEGILTLEQYRELQAQIYGTRELGLLMKPVNGMLEFVSKLQKDGYDLSIVTSRGEKESEIAKEWMLDYGLSLPLIAVGGGSSKADACNGLEVYVDDDLDKLEPLVGVVPHRFLFSWGYNEHIHVPESVASRVNSWRDFYDKISKLKDY